MEVILLKEKYTVRQTGKNASRGITRAARGETLEISKGTFDAHPDWFATPAQWSAIQDAEAARVKADAAVAAAKGGAPVEEEPETESSDPDPDAGDGDENSDPDEGADDPEGKPDSGGGNSE